MTVKPKITELLKQLNTGVYEKENVIALSFLSAVAGESIFLLGAPGVAKSLVARRLKYAFMDAKAFEYLMNRFSTPDEIFGPISISQLKDHDKYERIVINYLPTATVVFLDEIWKAGPSIQNALLTVLNEKIYRNGEKEIRVPIKAIISASNELPSKNEGLEALWDRFLIRVIVEGVKDPQVFNDMISKPLNPHNDVVQDALKITDEEYVEWNTKIDNIEIPEYVFNVIHIIRLYIEQHNQREENKDNIIYISDRRWKKIIRLIRTSAFLNDRNSADLMDCFLITHCIWNDPIQIETVSLFVKEAIHKHGYNLSINLSLISEEINDFKREVQGETSHMKKVDSPEVVFNEYYCIEGLDRPLIKENDFNQLTEEYMNIICYHNSPESWRRSQYYKMYNLKLSNKPNHIDHDGRLHKIRTSSSEKLVSKRPHPAVKKEWDKRAKSIIALTKEHKTTIQRYIDVDLGHTKTNPFVDSNLAHIVESNLIDLQNEIDKLEIEVRRIQHYYNNIENDVHLDNIMPVSQQYKDDSNLSDLRDLFDPSILKDLHDLNINTFSDFLSRDLHFYLTNTDIDEDTYYALKDAIENSLENGEQV